MTANPTKEEWYQRKNASNKTAADVLMDWLTTNNNLRMYLLSERRSAKSRANASSVLSNYLKNNSFNDISEGSIRQKIDSILETYTQARDWMDCESADIWQKTFVNDKEENIKRQREEIEATVLKMCPEFYPIDRLFAKEEDLTLTLHNNTRDDTAPESAESNRGIIAFEQPEGTYEPSKGENDFDWEQPLLEAERDMEKSWRRKEHCEYLKEVEELKESLREGLIKEDEYKRRRQRLFYEMQEDFFSDKMGH